MKTKIYLLLVLAVLVTASVGNAQNLIAVQSGSTNTFYTNLDTAIAHANNGDYIYVPGGSFTINNPIAKEVHIYGVGHNPDSTLATGFTQILGTITLMNGSSNSSIEGLFFNGGGINFGNTTAQNISGVIISGCNMSNINFFQDNGQIHYQNILIKQNIINGNVGGPSSWIDIQNSVLSNNIISGTANYAVYGFNNNCRIDNNIIFMMNTLSSMNGCNIDNNIIPNLSYGNITNCIFRNNLSNMVFENISGSNSFLNNIDNVTNQIFVYNPSVTFSYSHDYHLQSNCPGINAGTDGTDVGIYGGLYPWKTGSVPVNPHVQYKTIGGSTNTNGDLPVNIQVGAQDH